MLISLMSFCYMNACTIDLRDGDFQFFTIDVITSLLAKCPCVN